MSRRRGNTSQVSLRTAGVRRGLSAVLALASTLLSGCGPTRVRVDFTGYEKSYAITSNREVLLNLARLANHDPTYFFKLGQISSSYRMQASLPTTASYNPVGSAGTNELPGGGGSPSMIYENDPSFSFIPVNDETNARLLLAPVPSDVFYDLYYQGWRVDQLFRLMVERLEITLPNPDGSCRVEVIRNAPPPSFRRDASPIDYSHEQTSIAAYVTFLRVSAVVYALQKYGLLQLRSTDRFEPLDKGSFLPAETQSAGEAESPGAAGGKPQVETTTDHTTVIVTVPASKGEPGGGNSAAPTAKEFDETAAKNEYWELQTTGQGSKQVKRWVLGQMNHRTVFQLTSGKSEPTPKPEDYYGENVQDVENTLRHEIFPSDESLKELADAPELTDILEILYNGFSIEGPSAEQQPQSGFCPSGAQWSQGAPTRVVLRSLIGLMAAAAQEQGSFDQLNGDNIQILLSDKQTRESDQQLLKNTQELRQLMMKAAAELQSESEAQRESDLQRESELQQESSPLELLTGGIHIGLIDLAELQAENARQPDDVPAQAKPVLDLNKFDQVYEKQALNYLSEAHNNPTDVGTFKGLVPPIERLPVLQLDWAQEDQQQKNYLQPLETATDLKRAGFAVNYDNRDFLVTDANLENVPWKECVADSANPNLTCYAKENQFWNRDMFRLIGELSSQVTVDISKFPLPEILQLRTE